MNKLKRVKDGNNWLGGVCAGIAYWLGAPTWFIRLAWACVIIFTGFGIIPYILFWIFMPKWDGTPDDYKEVTE